jgi:hypothetical protein
LLGSRVAETVRESISISHCDLIDIVNVDAFESDPSVLMLGMLCALIASSVDRWRGS